MRKTILLFLLSFLSFTTFSQDDCFIRLQKAFDKRGSYTVANDMHKNVIVSFFEKDGETTCVAGKARVENGLIVSYFLQYEDNTYEFQDKKFYNDKKQSPRIVNGISEMIYNADGEKFKIVFIDQLKPKAKELKQVSLPDDL